MVCFWCFGRSLAVGRCDCPALFQGADNGHVPIGERAGDASRQHCGGTGLPPRWENRRARRSSSNPTLCEPGFGVSLALVAARPSLGVPRSWPDRPVNITRDWTLRGCGGLRWRGPRPAIFVRLALRAGESSDGRLCLAALGLVLDGLSVRDAILPSALRLDFSSPGSSILWELCRSFMGALDSCRPEGEAAERRWGAHRRGADAAGKRPMARYVPQVGVHGGGSLASDEAAGMAGAGPEPT